MSQMPPAKNHVSSDAEPCEDGPPSVAHTMLTVMNELDRRCAGSAVSSHSEQQLSHSSLEEAVAESHQSQRPDF